MLRALSSVSVVLLLAGCASAPKPQMQRSYTKPAKIVQAAPIDQTPNQAVKKRWFPKYKIKWLHPK